MAELTKQGTTEIYKTTLGAESDEVVIGDTSKTGELVPKIEFSKWAGEEKLSIQYESLVPVASAVVDDTLYMDTAKEGFYFRKPSDSNDIVKFGLILYEVPKVNRWVFKINADLEFVRPASILKDGVAQHIPEQLGGYKVNSKDGKEKFGFFYQPIFRDAKGNTCPAKLIIDNGEYIVTVNRDWLEKAVYPVIANDTFGSSYDGNTNIVVSVTLGDLIVIGYSYNDTTTNHLRKFVSSPLSILQGEGQRPQAP